MLHHCVLIGKIISASVEKISTLLYYGLSKTVSHLIIPGYEVHGLENIPDEGGALLIYYHGALPVDVYYMMGRLKTAKKRNLRNVVAEFMFYIPGKMNEYL